MTDVFTSDCAPYIGTLDNRTATFTYDGQADPPPIIKSILLRQTLVGSSGVISFEIMSEYATPILFVSFSSEIVNGLLPLPVITSVWGKMTYSIVGTPGNSTVIIDIPGNSITDGTNTIITAAGDHYEIKLIGCQNSNSAQVKLTRSRRVGLSVGGSANF